MYPLSSFEFFDHYMGGMPATIAIAKINGHWKVICSDDSLRFTELNVIGDYGTHNQSTIQIANTRDKLENLRYARRQAVAFRGELFVPANPRTDIQIEWLN